MDSNIDNLKYKNNELLTGLYDLDDLTGDLNNSKLILLASRPGMGKTNLILNIAKYIVTEEKIPVLIFSLKLSKKEVTRRFLATLKFSGKDKDNIKEIYIEDNSNISIEEIKEKSHKLKQEKNIGLVIIDYIQLLKEINCKRNNINTILLDVFYVLKELSTELNIPILITSQLSENPDKRFSKGQDAKPRLTDFEFSKDLIKELDIVLLLYRDDYYDKECDKRNIAEIEIAKNKNGKTGRIELIYLNRYYSFINLAKFWDWSKKWKRRLEY